MIYYVKSNEKENLPKLFCRTSANTLSVKCFNPGDMVERYCLCIGGSMDKHNACKEIGIEQEYINLILVCAAVELTIG